MSPNIYLRENYMQFFFSWFISFHSQIISGFPQQILYLGFKIFHFCDTHFFFSAHKTSVKYTFLSIHHGKRYLRTFKFNSLLLGHYVHTQKAKSVVAFHAAFPSEHCGFRTWASSQRLVPQQQKWSNLPPDFCKEGCGTASV